MTLELFLACSCWLSGANTNACTSMGEAYYKYEKLDQVAETINQNVHRQYPAVYFTSSVLASVQQRRINIPLFNGTYFGWEFPENQEPRFNCGWKFGF